jgi:phosphoglucosamine mutase
VSRRYFGTDGIRGIVGGDVINPQFALRLGYAAGRVIASRQKTKTRPAVLIGKDTRISGYMLEAALEAGFASAGVDVLLAGPIPTPAVAYLTRAWRLSAGVVISASHNPYYDNGIKFFSAQGMKLPDAVELEIEQALDQPMRCVSSDKLGKARRIDDAAGRYIEFCKSTFGSDLDLSGVTVVVDAAHGAAYDIAPHVFRELGATVHAIGVKPDGFNINEGVGAMHPENLIEQVKAHRADFGIALDGDADRIQIVDGEGRLYNGDELLFAVVRERAMHQQVAGVVGTLMSNLGLEQALGAQQIAFERAAVGDRYVLERMLEKGWYFGGESSGHLLFLDCHSTGDGIIAALQVLATVRRQGCSLQQWVSPLSLYPQVLINVKIDPNIDWRTHPGLISATTNVEKQLDGQGRVLIRASGTEPKLRLMVEAPDASRAQDLAQQLADSLA